MSVTIQLLFNNHSFSTRSGLSSGEEMFWYTLPFAFVILYLVYKYFINLKRVVNWKQGRVPYDFGTTQKHLAEVYIVFGASISKRGKKHIRTKERLINKYIKEHFP